MINKARYGSREVSPKWSAAPKVIKKAVAPKVLGPKAPRTVQKRTNPLGRRRGIIT
jgi:hypothetical protein